MSDLIDRQAAIDAAIEAVDDWDGGTNIGRQKRIEKAIKALPPVQSEPKSYRMGFQAGYAAAQRWIPCGVAFPEKEGVYLVTDKTAYGEKISMRYWNIHEKDAFWSGYESDVVTAWMPLPTPYREGEQA